MDEQLLLALMGEQPAIQNLDFLRQLIAETRGQGNYADMEKLRMLQGTGMGTDGLSTQRGDE
jgi:hypothetical protein